MPVGGVDPGARDEARRLARDEAERLDRDDPLARLRDRFHLPLGADGQPVAYFAGNSLGLQPKGAAALVEEALASWRERAVRGHFEGEAPWFAYHDMVRSGLAALAGAEPAEVVAMNGLTVNLHLLMASFYRPTGERRAIVIEPEAFPSDRYAAASQILFHGGAPERDLLYLPRRDGERTHRVDDVLAFLDAHAPRVALVLLAGVHYLTGEALPIAEVARWGRARGVATGVDLAHAMGNLPLRLHDWGVDFAAWCSYKYLNAGPGGTAGAFVHARWHGEPLPRLEGWWGHDPATRFAMPPRFQAAAGADAWQLSNCPILGTAPLRASLAVFAEAGGMGPLRARSERLTGLLERLLAPVRGLAQITPREPSRRGSQLSFGLAPGRARAVVEHLERRGVVCDVREPGILRAAPAALYSSAADCVRLAEGLAAALAEGAP